MPRCSIIIPVYNHASLTRQCLNLLLTQPPLGGDVEIIVVDDASTDATPAMLAGYGERIRVVRHTVNSGFSVGCNDGAALAQGEYLVFLNNDTMPQPGWLDAMVRYIVGHPEVGAVGSKLLYPNDTIQHAGVAISQDRFPRHIYTGFPADHPVVNQSRRFPIVTAACLLIPRALFAQVGGFDTVFINSYEDVDLCLRLGELGCEVHYCHESVLYHLESVSEGRLTNVDRNGQIYFSRWGHRVQPDDHLYFIQDGLLTFEYRTIYPLTVRLSPLLGIIEEADRAPLADRLLAQRSRQLLDLLKDYIRLTVRLKAAESGDGTEDHSKGKNL